MPDAMMGPTLQLAIDARGARTGAQQFDDAYDGRVFINTGEVALCVELEPYDALVLGGSLLKYASAYVALDEAAPAGSG